MDDGSVSNEHDGICFMKTVVDAVADSVAPEQVSVYVRLPRSAMLVDVRTCSVPFPVCFEPLHASDAVHVVAFLLTHERLAPPGMTTVPGPINDTVGLERHDNVPVSYGPATKFP